jgi:protein-tyrosine phosphatase
MHSHRRNRRRRAVVSAQGRALALSLALSRALALALALLALAACGGRPDPNLTPGPDPVVGRNAAGEIVVRYSGAPAGSRYRVFLDTSPDAIVRTAIDDSTIDPATSVGELDRDNELVVARVPVRPRPYFVIENIATGERRSVAERLLPMQGAHNFRDLGGYATADGRHVRWGQLYRSDHLGDLTDADVAFVKELGIRLVCDFRGEAERAANPDQLPGDPAPQVALLAIADDSFDPEELQRRILSGELEGLDLGQVLIEGNRKFATEYRDRYAQLFERLSDPRRIPALVHCTAGKDRAGFASALILRVLGVPEETVYQDFLRTNVYTAEFIERTLMMIRVASLFRTDPEDVRPLMSVRREYLEAAFDTIDEEYGGFDAYVRNELGVRDEARRALQDRLLH